MNNCSLYLSLASGARGERDHDGRLQLGHRFAVPYLEHVAGSVLAELQQQTGETAQIRVRRGEHRLCLASADSPAELRASVPVGTLGDAGPGALYGDALLAAAARLSDALDRA
jgi:DNA-binding IclR family transcriptional regulator